MIFPFYVVVFSFTVSFLEQGIFHMCLLPNIVLCAYSKDSKNIQLLVTMAYMEKFIETAGMTPSGVSMVGFSVTRRASWCLGGTAHRGTLTDY